MPAPPTSRAACAPCRNGLTLRALFSPVQNGTRSRTVGFLVVNTHDGAGTRVQVMSLLHHFLACVALGSSPWGQTLPEPQPLPTFLLAEVVAGVWEMPGEELLKASRWGSQSGLGVPQFCLHLECAPGRGGDRSPGHRPTLAPGGLGTTLRTRRESGSLQGREGKAAFIPVSAPRGCEKPGQAQTPGM